MKNELTKKFFKKGKTFKSFGNSRLAKAVVMTVAGGALTMAAMPNEAKADSSVSTIIRLTNRLNPGTLIRTGFDIVDGVNADSNAEEAKADAALKAEEAKQNAALRAEQEKKEAEKRYEEEMKRIEKSRQNVSEIEGLTVKEQLKAERQAQIDERKAAAAKARAEAKAARAERNAQARADRQEAREARAAERQAKKDEKKAIRSTEKTANQLLRVFHQTTIRNK